MADTPPDVDQLFPEKPPPDVDELFPASVEDARHYRAINTGTERASPVQDFLLRSDGPVGSRLTRIGHVLESFGQGFKHGWGSEPLGLSDESIKTLREHGVFNDWEKGHRSILKGFNEGIVRPAAAGLDALARGVFQAPFTGYQEAMTQAGEEYGFPGLARDVAAVPEAFLGSPHPTGTPHPPGPEPIRQAPGITAEQAASIHRVLNDAAGLKVIGPDGEAGFQGTKPTADGAPTVSPPVEPPPETPPAPDLHAMVRQASPQLFDEYDALSHRRDILRRFIEDREDVAKPTADLARVARDLKETEARWHDLAPQVADAYRKAEADVVPAAGVQEGGIPAAYTPGLHAQGLDASDEIKKQWAATSPIKSIDDLFAKAQENQDALADTSNKIANELGVEFRNPGVKDRPRTQEKIDQGKAPGRVNDVVRGGFVVDSPAQGDAIVQRLAQSFETADEGWFVTPLGYFDRKVIVRFPNGQAGEIQIWHPDMLRAKQDTGHRLYVEWRSLPLDDPRRAVLHEHMKAIYDGALADATPEWRSLIGKGGTEGYLASKAALESTRPSMETAASSTRPQLPTPEESALNDQALIESGPRASTKGSPSQEPYVREVEGISTSTKDIGIPSASGNRIAGETDKQFAKRVVDKRAVPAKLPEDYEKYFNLDDRTVVLPIDKLVSSKTAEENVQGGENGAKRMAAAAAGELARRDPITVSRQDNGAYRVVDGNGTLTSVKKYGWEGMPVHIVEDEPPRLRIASDVTSRLMAAGRPQIEAEASGRIIQAYWETRAARFKGRKGTAEEMHAREAPHIVGGVGTRPTGPVGEAQIARAEAALASPPVTPADATIPPADRAAPLPHQLPNTVRMFSPGELKVDANRFQFKAGGNEAGVTDRLSGVKTWDPIKAGMSLVWQDRAGNNFIVDGHQRHALATRIAEEDSAQKPQLLARVVREADGVTDVAARVMAAAKNIAEGTGSAIDAAKVLRDRPDLVGELPPSDPLVRQARGLANLSNEAFGMVINDVVPPNYAAIVGRLAPQDAQLQSALLGLLAKTEPANAVQAEAIVRQGIEAGLAREMAQRQGSLFGDQDVATSLYGERAKVLDRALKELKRDKTVFSVLSREVETIEAAGNKLAAHINEKRAAADAQALQVLQVLASRKGPISDALNAAARRARSDGKPGAAVGDFIAEVRRLVETGDLARLADGVERGPTHVGAEDASRVVERAPERVSEAAEAKAAAEIKDVEEKTLEFFQRRKGGRDEFTADMFGGAEPARPVTEAARPGATVEATRAGPQQVLPGMERSAAQAAAGREAAGGLRTEKPQEAPGDLFAEHPTVARELFDQLPEPPTAPTLAETGEPGGAGAGPEAGPDNSAVPGGAPQVPPREPARRPRGSTPVRQPGQLSLFGGGDGEPAAGARPEPAPERPGGAEAAVPGAGEGVTKPPAVGGGGDQERPDTPTTRGLSAAEQKIAERSRSNYRITPDDLVGEGTPKQKVRGNLEAIRVLKEIEDEGREATPAEKAILVKYTGWGAHAQEMFAERRPEWANERTALRAALSDAEYEAARASTPNAHFTSPEVVRGMWAALDHLGFRGGLAIEPSAGIGHFIGLIPDTVAPKTAWTAVELDSITGRIAKALYGGAEVNVHGFEDLKRPSNYYDLAISNVPFGDYPLKEKPYGSFPIHDFFFVKSLDKVRPGGMVAFITSRYSMDRVDPATRRLLGKTSDLVGAIRLPGGRTGAFSKNAGTEVTTDILFLRKKIPGETPFPGADWTDLKEIQTPEGPAKINQYFADHPEMMLGEMRLQGTQYRAGEPVLVGDTEGIEQRVAEAGRRMRAGAITPASSPATTPKIAPDLADPIHANDIAAGIRDGAFFVRDGKVYQRAAGQGIDAQLSAADGARVSKLVGIRDTINDLMQSQLGGASALEKGVLREKLRKAYDAFVAEHGPINLQTKTVTSRIGKDGEPITITRSPNLAPFKEDPDAWKVAAIENYDADSGKASRADIQSKDVIAPPRERQINGPSDALAASLDDTGAIDLDRIARALNLDTHEDAAHALGDLVFHNPDGRHWETADQYLSGDVVKKLEDARTIAKDDPGYLRNVAALEKVQPTPLKSHEIMAQFGAPWVPPETYADFFKSLGVTSPRVSLVPVTKEWRLNIGMASRDAEAKFGTTYFGLDQVADAAMNNKKLTAYDGKGDERTVNQKATEEANVKVQLLKEAFAGDPETGAAGWVWDDGDRAQQLEAIYNRTFNNIAPRKFDGSHLTLPGLNPDFATRQHRKDAVWRMVQNGNTLLAHVVGSGKTATMIAGGQEMKRLGLINKPAYVVPNHMLEQFSREFIQAYPNAKILVAQKEEMSRDNRRAFIAKTAANDWDGVIITHDAFGRINVDPEFRRKFLGEQLDELERLIKTEAEEGGDKSPTVKALEKAKKRLSGKLTELMNEERKDEGVSFEQTGIDHLFVDEAHKFKNLAFNTRMQRIKGLAQGDSQRAEDLFLKIRQLEQKRPGRSAVFATGTPVSNTMAELWTMMRYLGLDKLKERGLDSFDAWAQTFGRVTNTMELSADGRTFKEASSFSKFVNVPELINIYGEIADTKTADMLNLKRPEVKTRSGAPGINIVEATPSEAEEAHINHLVQLAESLKGKRPEPGQPNILSVVTQGRKVATDGRLIGPDFEFNPQGKIAHAVDNIHRIWKEGNEDTATAAAHRAPMQEGMTGEPEEFERGPLKVTPNGKVQMVFLDLGTPKTKGAPKRAVPGEDIEGEGVDPAQAEGSRLDLYADLKRRLIDKGIPADEIAAIHDAPDDAKKARLFERVRRGDVRVFLGSSEKMGVGTNVQDRLIAMHHLDAPWKPAEVEQRDGRIVRQGNKNPEVQIYRYVTKRSFDAFMWQKLDTKSKFIGQVLSGAKGSRFAEDIDNPLPEAAEMKAAASGDPRILEHAELDRQVRALTAQRRAFEQTRSRADWELKTAQSRIEQYEKALPDAKEDAAQAADISGDKFAVEMGDKTVTDRAEAGKEILDGLLKLDAGNFYRPTVVTVGRMAGFDMNVRLQSAWDREGTALKAEFSLKGKSGYGSPNDAVINAETPGAGLIRRFENILAGIRQNPDRLTGELERERGSVNGLTKTLGEQWPKEADYRSALGRLDELTKSLKAKEHPDVAEAKGAEAKAGEQELFQEKQAQGPMVHIVHSASGKVAGVFTDEAAARSKLDEIMRKQWERHGETLNEEEMAQAQNDAVNRWNGEHPRNEPIDPETVGYHSDIGWYEESIGDDNKVTRKLLPAGLSKQVDGVEDQVRPYPGAQAAARYFRKSFTEGSGEMGDLARAHRITSTPVIGDIRELSGFHFGEGKQGELFQIKALHASPHEFIKFDLSKAGTGVNEASPMARGVWAGESEAVSGRGGQYDKILTAKTGKPAHIYEVSIDAEPEDFLDYSKPLSEQSPKVRKAIEGLEKHIKVGLLPTARNADQRIYRELLTEATNPRDLLGALEGGTSHVDASRILKEAGIAGVRSVDPGASTYHYVVFDDAKIKITRKDGEAVSSAERSEITQSLFQGGETKQGKITLRKGERPIITMFRTADASTFMHETGHDWLDRMMRDAEDPDAPADIKADATTVFKWLGVDKAADIKARHHEKFARGFETYLMEGRAPSRALAGVFEKFRQWLIRIYREVTNLKAPISDEIRGVFNRLLAVEPERTVETPDREPAAGIADIHEGDIAAMTPETAHAVGETIRSERDRSAAHDSAEDTAARLADAREAPGGSAPGGAEPGGDGDEAGAVGGGHRTSAPSGTQRPGGSEGEGDGAQPRQEPAEPPGPSVKTEPPASPAESFETKSPLVDKAGNIRLDLLQAPEDVKRVIRDAADQNNEFLAARRGKVSDQQVLDLADALGMDAARLNQRRIGQAFNAEEIVAARKLLIQSATAVRDAMMKAAEGNEADVAAFAEARERHLMIQEQVSGITAEAGRALRAFRHLAGMKEARELGDFLRDATGLTLFQLKRMAQLGSALPTAQQVSRIVHSSAKPGFGDMMLEYWINALISGPATHTTYAIGNALLALNKAGPETGVAAAIGSIRRAFGDQGPRVYWGEVPAQLSGMVKGFPDAIVATWESLKTGRTTPLPGELAGMTPREMALSPLVNPRAAIPNFTVGGIPVPLGTFLRLPSRVVAMIHSFTRFTNFSREKAAIAYRTAASEGLDGQAFAARIADIYTNPNVDVMRQSRESATDLALMGRGGELTQALSRLTNARFLGFQWLKFIDPFVHISSNVIEQGILQRTIVGVLDPEIRANLSGANGPVARDMAIARMVVGTGIAVGVGSLAAQGLVNGSGPSDPHEAAVFHRANGPPHSIRVGNMWYDIHRLGPLGMQFSIAADIYHLADVIGKEDGAKVVADISHAFTQNILDESFMRGPADLMKALSDPDRYGAGWVKNFVSSFVPFSVGESQIARAIDPYSRSARTTLDAMKAKVPLLSQTLLPRLDVFGEPIPNKEAFGIAGLSAIYEEAVKNDPVDKAMLNAGYFPAMPLRKIRNVELTDQQYYDYARIAGRTAKIQLNEIVRSPGFNDYPPGVRHDLMRNAVTKSRQMAEALVMMQSVSKENDIVKSARDAKVAKLRGEPVH